MRFRLFTLITALFLVMALAVAVAGCSSLPENAAASVNGVIITKEAVQERIENLRKTNGAMIPREDQEDLFGDFRRGVADQLVREEIERQETERRNITVSQAEVDERMLEIADDKFLGDVSKLIAEYQGKGISLEEMQSDVSRQILHEKMQAEIGKDIQVTDQDALNYYEQNRNNYVRAEQRQLRQLVADNESTAQDVIKRTQAGEDFLQLVTEYSIDPNASTKKGTLGLVSQGQLAPELDVVAFALGLNQISGPVSIEDKWYVIKVEGVIPPFSTPFEEAKQDIIALLGGREFSERWREFTNGVYEMADIEFSPDYDPQFKVGKTGSA